MKLRYFIDISAVPGAGETVTGIARVILAFIWHLATAHDQDIDLYGISFRSEDGGYRVWDLRGVACCTEGIVSAVEHIRHTDPVGIDWTPHDVVLLLGEQWLFGPSVSEVAKLKKNKAIIVISLLHDFVPFFMPELYWDGFSSQYIQCITDLIHLSDSILVYSNSTRRDLLRFFPNVDAQKPVTTIRLGDDFDAIAKRSHPAEVDGLPGERFVLVVGTLQPRKNHAILLPVWRRLLLEQPERCPMLVLAGKKGWHVDEFLYFCNRNPDLHKKIKVLDNIDDGKLRWLYENALFSIYPSLYEGWGLPIAESLAFGRACLASNTSAMPEIAGDLIDYFSPYDTGELFHLIDRYLKDPSLLTEKERSIKSRFRKTVWSRTVKEVVRAVDRVILCRE